MSYLCHEITAKEWKGHHVMSASRTMERKSVNRRGSSINRNALSLRGSSINSSALSCSGRSVKRSIQTRWKQITFHLITQLIRLYTDILLDSSSTIIRFDNRPNDSSTHSLIIRKRSHHRDYRRYGIGLTASRLNLERYADTISSTHHQLLSIHRLPW